MCAPELSIRDLYTEARKRLTAKKLFGTLEKLLARIMKVGNGLLW